MISFKHPLAVVIVSVVLAAATAFCITRMPDAKPRIAYVDMSTLLNSYEAMSRAKRMYHDQKKDWDENIATLEHELQQIMSELANMQINKKQVSVLELEQQKQLFIIKKQQLEEYKNAIAEKEEKELERLTQEVMMYTDKRIKAYGINNNYDIIFSVPDKNIIAYAKQDFDITSDLIRDMNKVLTDSLSKNKVNTQMR